jgi:hypothetical protein
METKIFYAFIITLTECYLIYNNISTGYPILGGYPIGTSTGTVYRPIGLVDMDICRSLGYNFGSGIIITDQNPTRCHPYTRRRELSFEVGDFVYLKVSPIRGVRRFGVKGKLAPRYVGPY